MLAFVRQAIASCRLRRKVTLTVALAVAIVACASAVGLRIVVSRYDKLLYSAMVESLTPFVREIEANLQLVDMASAFIISDQGAQDTLEAFVNAQTASERSLTNKDLYAVLYKQASLNKYISDITIIAREGEALTAYTSPLPKDEAFYERVVDKAREYNGSLVWLWPGGTTGGVVCARSIKKIRSLSLEELGVLIIHVDLEKIIRDAQAATGGHLPPSIAIVSGGRAIYPKDGREMADMLPPDTPYGIRELDGEKQFVVQRPAGGLGWVYMGFSPYNDIFESIIFAQIMYIVAVAAAIGTSILVASRLTRSITCHFDKLGRKMESFASGNLTPIDVQYDYSRRQDELGVIHRHYDRMLESITDLIEDNYVKQLLIKDARIKTLEQQINPHFLYNTLNSIHWRAVAADQPEISDMVQALAGMLRDSLSEQADTVPLRKELAIVENYVRIQKMRYEERMDYSADIDPALLELPVPKMSIQPLVENAIKYSLEEVTENCVIRLRAWTGDTAVIEVSNSGSRIDEDILEKLARREIRPRGQGIGLQNIDSRIRLLFGREYGLRFCNRDDHACAVMLLPLTEYIKTEEANYAAAFDR